MNATRPNLGNAAGNTIHRNIFQYVSRQKKLVSRMTQPSFEVSEIWKNVSYVSSCGEELVLFPSAVLTSSCVLGK